MPLLIILHRSVHFGYDREQRCLNKPCRKPSMTVTSEEQSLSLIVSCGASQADPPCQDHEVRCGRSTDGAWELMFLPLFDRPETRRDV